MAEEKKLTDKQKMFCHEYVKDFNGARAAVSAGYSEDSARQGAHQILTNIYVYEYIQELVKKKMDKVDLTADRVLAEYAKIAFIDIQKFYDENGNLKEIKDLSEDASASMAGIKIHELKDSMGIKYGELKEIKLHDKLRALESLSKYLGIYAKDNDQKKVEATLFYLPKEDKPVEDTPVTNQ